MGKVFRGDIFTINFEGGNGLIKGVHPAIVVNSVRSIMKADIITVLPITSKNLNRLLKSHVRISGFGLKVESKVLVEQSTTISKSELISYIGHVDGVKMQQINRAMKMHLDLDRKSLNVEELVSMLDNKQSNTRQLEILKAKIYTSYLEERNKETDDMCNKLIEESKKTNDRYYIWYGLYMKSLTDLKLNNNSTKNIEESLKYSDEDSTLRLSLWCYSRLLESVDKEKAISIYLKLSKAYREDMSHIERLSVLFNIAKLKGNIKAGKRLVAIAKCLDLNCWSYANKKEDYINQLETELNTFSV